MFDDIKIGKGETGITTIKTFKIKGDHRISDNMVCFRCSDIFMGIGITIMKDTSQGKKLQKMVDENKPYEKIKEYLTQVILRNSPSKLIINKFVEAKDESYQLGKEVKSKEIRDILGIIY